MRADNRRLAAQRDGVTELIAGCAIARGDLLLLRPHATAANEDVNGAGCGAVRVRQRRTHDGGVSPQRYGETEGIPSRTVARRELLLLGPDTSRAREHVRSARICAVVVSPGRADDGGVAENRDGRAEAVLRPTVACVDLALERRDERIDFNGKYGRSGIDDDDHAAIRGGRHPRSEHGAVRVLRGEVGVSVAGACLVFERNRSIGSNPSREAVSGHFERELAPLLQARGAFGDGEALLEPHRAAQVPLVHRDPCRTSCERNAILRVGRTARSELVRGRAAPDRGERQGTVLVIVAADMRPVLVVPKRNPFRPSDDGPALVAHRERLPRIALAGRYHGCAKRWRRSIRRSRGRR